MFSKMGARLQTLEAGAAKGENAAKQAATAERERMLRLGNSTPEHQLGLSEGRRWSRDN